MDTDITIIPHAKLRMKGRVYCDDIYQKATLAWRNGLRIEEATGPLKEYLVSKHIDGRIMSIYRSSIYVFEPKRNNELHLITVLIVPKQYQHMAKKQLTKKMVKCNGQTGI